MVRGAIYDISNLLNQFVIWQFHILDNDLSSLASIMTSQHSTTPNCGNRKIGKVYFLFLKPPNESNWLFCFVIQGA